ncbi:hypothetical protein [Hymenobacter fodinae]|uniref:Uncharacterized protein n=1 Tax=Hymenobacter fodinae TaxID=2510796 RepID=A0A4Z0P9V2_9BACT|nr:hypothetical protein [Hymenobacter fodinae]TGE08750.1 hypothetical protein EU556_13775 [Hymenobacter fodinae]
MAATSNKYRFKASYKDATVTVHTPKTRNITAANFVDSDVEVLKSHGRGHVIELIPASAAAPDADKPVALSGLRKDELQEVYRTELKAEPGDDLKVDDLKEAIEKHRNDSK